MQLSLNSLRKEYKYLSNNQIQISNDLNFEDVQQQVFIKRVHSSSINKPCINILDCSNNIQKLFSLLNQETFPQNLQKLNLSTCKISNLQRTLLKASKKAKSRPKSILITQQKYNFYDSRYKKTTLKQQKTNEYINSNYKNNINIDNNHHQNNRLSLKENLSNSYISKNNFIQLSNLKQLILDNNLIEQVPIQLISKLILLKKLSFANNLITKMDDFIHNSYLVYVYARMNPIKVFNLNVGMVFQNETLQSYKNKNHNLLRRKIDFQWIDYLGLCNFSNIQNSQLSLITSRKAPNNINSNRSIHILNSPNLPNKQFHSIINSNDEKQPYDEFNKIIQFLKQEKISNKRADNSNYEEQNLQQPFTNKPTMKVTIVQIKFDQFMTTFIRLKGLASLPQLLKNQQSLNSVLQKQKVCDNNHNSNSQNIHLDNQQRTNSNPNSTYTSPLFLNFISLNLRKSILNEFQSFIDFCYTLSHDIDFSSIKYKGVLILEYVLENDYDYGLQLFIQQSNRKHLNLRQNTDKICELMFLACNYSNWKLYKFVSKMLKVQKHRKPNITPVLNEPTDIYIANINTKQPIIIAQQSLDPQIKKIEFIQKIIRSQHGDSQLYSMKDLLQEKCKNIKRKSCSSYQKIGNDIADQNSNKIVYVIPVDSVFYKIFFQLLVHFDLTKKSHRILQSLLTLLQTIPHRIVLIKIAAPTHQIYKSLKIQQKQSFVKCLLHIINNKSLSKRFIIQQQKPYLNQRLLLEIASGSKNTQLAICLIYRLDFDVMARNRAGKIARTQKLLMLNRKILYQTQLKMIERRFREWQNDHDDGNSRMRRKKYQTVGQRAGQNKSGFIQPNHYKYRNPIHINSLYYIQKNFLLQRSCLHKDKKPTNFINSTPINFDSLPIRNLNPINQKITHLKNHHHRQPSQHQHPKKPFIISSSPPQQTTTNHPFQNTTHFQSLKDLNIINNKILQRIINQEIKLPQVYISGDGGQQRGFELEQYKVYEQFQLMNEIGYVEYLMGLQQEQKKKQGIEGLQGRKSSSIRKKLSTTGEIRKSSFLDNNDYNINSVKQKIINNFCLCTCVELQNQNIKIQEQQYSYDLDKQINFNNARYRQIVQLNRLK